MYATHGDDYDIGGNGGGLESQSWYWGNVDKEEVNRILMAKAHGHFLVRDSTTSGEYTLVVRRQERVRNIRILRDVRGYYGVVANRCDFLEVADLILYLMNHPKFLHQHFSRLDLLYPISKPESVEEESTHELLTRLVMRNKDLVLQNEQYINHVKQRKLTQQEVQQCKMTTASLSVVLSLFEEQLAVLNMELSGDLMKPSGDGAREEVSSSVALNREAVHERVERVRRRLEEEGRKERELSSRALRLLESIHQMKALLSTIQQDVTFLRLRVEEKGLSRDYLDLLLKDDKDIDLSHYDTRNWLVQCDRQEGERQLHHRVPGTFLVRPCSNGGHAVSVVCAIDDRVETRHCLIHKDPHTFRYGFHPDYCIFSSLEELVSKHQTISLSFYNSRLDVCLTYPVNYRTAHDLPPRP